MTSVLGNVLHKYSVRSTRMRIQLTPDVDHSIGKTRSVAWWACLALEGRTHLAVVPVVVAAVDSWIRVPFGFELILLSKPQPCWLLYEGQLLA